MSLSDKYPAVHWFDGMKLRSDHFNQFANHFYDQMRDAISLGASPVRYGLLPDPEGHSSLSWSISITGKMARVELKKCNAVTASGHRIILDNRETTTNSVFAEINLEAESISGGHNLAVMVASDAFHRIPVGNVDGMESPVNPPHTAPVVKLNIRPQEMVSSEFIMGNEIQIGQIRMQGNSCQEVTEYIPPCCLIAAHPALLESRKNVLKLLTDLSHSCSIIISKSFHPRTDKMMAEYTRQIARALLDQIAGCRQPLHFRGKWMPPVIIIETAAAIAAAIHFALEGVALESREKMITYYYHWMDGKPGDFTQALADIIQLDYNHTNIQGALSRAEEKLRYLAKLFAKLSELEFIGQEKENMVVRKNVSGNNSTQNKANLID